MGRKKPGSIAFVVDEKLSRDRRGILGRVVNTLRQHATVQLISGNSSEAEVLKQLGTGEYALVLAPWYQYFAWSKVEALYGLTRTSGPTFAGYFAEPIQPNELGDQSDHFRAILLDFVNLSAVEAAVIIQSLLEDHQRTGIRPLLDPSAVIYCESWYQGQGQGLRIDNVLSLPEIAKSEWNSRSASIRILLNAFWSLIYDEGPGKSELTQAISGNKAPRAYMTLGCDGRALAFRLCYSMPGWSAKEALASFWPDMKRPTAASQLLLKFSDFLRVHTIAESSDVEIVAGLFQSAPSEKAHSQVHTLWVEPIAANLVKEVPFENPSPASPHLRALPALQLPAAGAKTLNKDHSDEAAKAKDRFLFEAAVKIRELKKMVEDRDALIRDLKSGGVGTAAPLPPPDAEGLLEAFQERYFEARYQIRQFELQIAELERKGATPQEIEALRLRISALTAREQGWIKKLAATIESFRTARQGTGSQGG